MFQPVDLGQTQAYRPEPSYAREDELAMADAAMSAVGRPDTRGGERREPVQSRRASTAVNPKDPNTWGKVSRNAPCPCGSGKKFKHCHGIHA
jgi:preprotein translocase subunit SecA